MIEWKNRWMEGYKKKEQKKVDQDYSGHIGVSNYYTTKILDKDKKQSKTLN